MSDLEDLIAAGYSAREAQDLVDADEDARQKPRRVAAARAATRFEVKNPEAEAEIQNGGPALPDVDSAYSAFMQTPTMALAGADRMLNETSDLLNMDTAASTMMAPRAPEQMERASNTQTMAGQPLPTPGMVWQGVQNAPEAAGTEILKFASGPLDYTAQNPLGVVGAATGLAGAGAGLASAGKSVVQGARNLATGPMARRASAAGNAAMKAQTTPGAVVGAYREMRGSGLPLDAPPNNAGLVRSPQAPQTPIELPPAPQSNFEFGPVADDLDLYVDPVVRGPGQYQMDLPPRPGIQPGPVGAGDVPYRNPVQPGHYAVGTGPSLKPGPTGVPGRVETPDLNPPDNMVLERPQGGFVSPEADTLPPARGLPEAKTQIGAPQPSPLVPPPPKRQPGLSMYKDPKNVGVPPVESVDFNDLELPSSPFDESKSVAETPSAKGLSKDPDWEAKTDVSLEGARWDHNNTEVEVPVLPGPTGRVASLDEVPLGRKPHYVEAELPPAVSRDYDAGPKKKYGSRTRDAGGGKQTPRPEREKKPIRSPHGVPPDARARKPAGEDLKARFDTPAMADKVGRATELVIVKGVRDPARLQKILGLKDVQEAKDLIAFVDAD